MNIGPPIDWAATGSMLSGFATLAGALAVIVVAKIGGDKFTDWKKQQVAERKMAFAEELLVGFYQFERILGFVRGEMQYPTEVAEARAKLGENMPNLDSLPEDKLNRLTTAQIAITRIAQQRSSIDKIMEMLPITKALFPELSEHVNSAWRQANRVGIAANTYASRHTFSDDSRARLELDLWGTYDDDDRINRTVEAAKLELERVLLPVIHDGHND